MFQRIWAIFAAALIVSGCGGSIVEEAVGPNNFVYARSVNGIINDVETSGAGTQFALDSVTIEDYNYELVTTPITRVGSSQSLFTDGTLNYLVAASRDGLSYSITRHYPNSATIQTGAYMKVGTSPAEMTGTARYSGVYNGILTSNIVTSPVEVSGTVDFDVDFAASGGTVSGQIDRPVPVIAGYNTNQLAGPIPFHGDLSNEIEFEVPATDLRSAAGHPYGAVTAMLHKDGAVGRFVFGYEDAAGANEWVQELGVFSADLQP